MSASTTQPTTHSPPPSEAPPEALSYAEDVVSERAETASASSSDTDTDDDEEPRLKYIRLTKSLSSVYRNGDAVSATLAFGERMVRELPLPHLPPPQLN